MSSRRLYTLAFVRDGSRILLGYKKRGFGSGRWNGFGGKLEPNETVYEAAARELHEESGLSLSPSSLFHIGRLEFEFVGEPELMQVEVFTSTLPPDAAEPRESDEMRPRWYTVDALPFANMWPDDQHWFPYMLNNKYFFGKFLFKGHDLILEHALRNSSAEELAKYKPSEVMSDRPT